MGRSGVFWMSATVLVTLPHTFMFGEGPSCVAQAGVEIAIPFPQPSGIGTTGTNH